ncbi:MAG: outer membrane protein assembly factor BamB family protein, partial [Ktedonobacterales bacterium]
GQQPVTSGSSTHVNALEAATGTIRWQQELGLNVSGTPTVYDHVVYVVGQQNSSTPELFAYRASDGALLWHTTSSPDSTVLWDSQRAPLVADGLVYTPLTSRVAALHASTGTVAWSWSEVTWSVAIPNFLQIQHIEPLAAGHGLLVVSATVSTREGEQTYTVVLRAKDGRPLWETPLTSSSALVAADALYLYTQQGLYAFRASDGKPLWILPQTQALSFYDNGHSSLSSTGQRLYIHVNEITEGRIGPNLLYAINTRDGSILWKSDVGANSRGIPVEANGMVYVTSGLTSSGTTYGDTLFALQAQDGHLLWRLQSKSAYFGTPLVLDQVVFIQAHFQVSRFTCPSGYSLYEALLAANATTGALYWRSAANPRASDPVGDVQAA